MSLSQGWRLSTFNPTKEKPVGVVLEEDEPDPHPRALPLSLLAVALSISAFSQTPAPDPKVVPVIDGGIGACSADFTVTDADGAPVYAAKIKVHIAYGFMYARKLDLEVGTNVDGKARFTGLPDRVKQASSSKPPKATAPPKPSTIPPPPARLNSP